MVIKSKFTYLNHIFLEKYFKPEFSKQSRRIPPRWFEGVYSIPSPKDAILARDDQNIICSIIFYTELLTDIFRKVFESLVEHFETTNTF